MKLDPLRLMRWAEDVSTDSTCAKIQVGAVLVNARGQVISTGFNGTPAGHLHCDEFFSGTMSRLALGEEVFLSMHASFSEREELHAEQNCILYAPQASWAGTTLFCTWSPCFACGKVILTAGIKKVFYRTVYKQDAIDYLSRHIEMEQI